VTSEKLSGEAWPWADIDDVYYMPEEEDGSWNMNNLINAIAFKMREINFNRFVALDDFDVEKVSRLREQFRVPGMGDTTSRYFRDKLAMRVKAKLENIPVPEFTPLFNDAAIQKYVSQVAPPWMIKPRSEASAVGIQKIYSEKELWECLDELGDLRHRYLLEKFSPGTVYHVDALTYQGKVVFSRVSRYLDTPFEVAHGGGIFRSHTCDLEDKAAIALSALNEKVLEGFGMQYSASHTEFIESKETGALLFLETSSRVGGANLAEMVEHASGVNLWAEWAKLETAMLRNKPYKIPVDKKNHAGIVVSLCRFQNPDTSAFTDKELVWKMEKKWHIGLIVKSKKVDRVLDLLDSYTERIHQDFHATAPAPDKSP
jgi:biotin carboxylase